MKHTFIKRKLKEESINVFMLQRSLRGRGSAIISGARMSILRGERRRESRGGSISVSGAPAGGKIGPAAAGIANPQEARCTLGVESPRHDFR